LSNNWDNDNSEFLNDLRFLSDQITQTHKSQMICKKERYAQSPPDEYVNCRKWSEIVWDRKWSEIVWESTDENALHDRTNGQKEPKISHFKINILSISQFDYQTRSYKKGRREYITIWLSFFIFSLYILILLYFIYMI
jgi:hypothetical protein